MSINAFNLKVTSSSPVAEQLMVVLNPKLMMNQGVIYKDYYPVAWHVLEFPVGADPIMISYDSNLTAILQEITDQNIVNAGVHRPTTTDNNEFNIVTLNNMYDLQPQGKINPNTAVSIYNDVSGKTFDVGVGDTTGRSYLTMNVTGGDSIDFNFNAEFAIVPVGPTVQDKSKMVTGTVHRPWFSFMLRSLTSDDIGFTFDGTNLVDVTGIAKVDDHRANEEVFG
ncbi:hypothetical protein EC973_004143 [Apophysomyces ossiformis]|uniref:Uncharacterized protein n=1 Tax=Apophysomyces ossiformis TaxID=679940 RepID=A0A8H7EMM8_9FUNG|nr:hypothetical protein EC973_004143 [Apophysomyces ossiformis]